MVITELIGGIGNQLFQYAAARSLAYSRAINLKLDLSAFENYKLHQYSLQHFNIPASIAVAADLRQTSYVFHEKSFHFDPHFEKLPSSVLLKGYWQSEKYFSAIEDVIRKDLQIQIPLQGLNKSTADHIHSCQSVSLHIRRGDYVTNAHTMAYHGLCDLAYYDKCIYAISQQVTHPHFFIFSDDPDWAMANLKIAHDTTYVTHNNAETNYEDLRLMSLCQHQIIANSTFSWWGAWLNTSNTKIVIAPKNWFKSAALNTADLIPDSWMVI
jgi:hypothetical protein